MIRDAADATVEYAGKAADAAGPVLRDAAEATSQAASAAVEQMQEIDWGDVDPGCSYNCGILEDTDLTRMGEMLGGAAAPAPPEADEAPADDAPADDAAAPPTPWVSGYSTDGHLYYYNTQTGESSWTLPQAVQ